MATIARVLVVGAGASGLRVALELLQRHINISVVVRAPQHPLEVAKMSNCSVGAGGFWKPSFTEDPRTDEWALETLEELLQLASKPDASNNKTNRISLVEVLPAVILSRSESRTLPVWSQDRRLNFEQITVDELAVRNQTQNLGIPPVDEIHDAGYKYAWVFDSPIVNAPQMLQFLLEQLQSNSNCDVDVNTKRYYTSMEQLCQEADSLQCDAVVNCTGLGARDMVDDDALLVGGRGVIHMYDRRTCARRRRRRGWDTTTSVQQQQQEAAVRVGEEPWALSTNMPCYLYPRGDVIVVGGSCSEENMSTDIQPHEHDRLIENARILGIDTNACKPVSSWVGFRPCRPTIRCEVDEKWSQPDLRVMHCYGLGGSGWTINVGVAKTCVDELFSVL